MASHKDGLRTRHTSQPVQGAYHAARAPVQDVGVDLRGLDVTMAQQLLHGADVIAGFKQVGGEGVSDLGFSVKAARSDASPCRRAAGRQASCSLPASLSPPGPPPG